MEKSAILYLWKTNDRICYQQCSSKLFSIKLYLPPARPASQPETREHHAVSEVRERIREKWLVG